jgi:5-methyltetrahydropteroyltriglutamate--homocysteine methyltransferase
MFANWRLSGPALTEGQEDSVRLWVADQEKAGLDVVTDGEQRRRHYIWGFYEGLEGIDTVNLGKRTQRGGRYHKESPPPAWSANPNGATRSSPTHSAPQKP